MNALSQAQVIRVLNHVEAISSNPIRVMQHRRDALIIGALIHGLRTIEVTRLKRQDLDADSNTLRFQTAKGGAMHTINVAATWPAAATDCWKEYQRKHGDRRLLFTSRNGKQLDTTAVWVLTTRICRQLLNVNASPHMFRHSAATICYQQCKDPAVVMDLLGHKNLRHTIRYLATLIPVPSNSTIDILRAARPGR